MKQTTKTLLTSLVFLVVAASIGLAALWVNKDEEKKTEQKEKSARLFELDKTRLRELRLTKAGTLVAAVKREGATSPWKIVEPISADADEPAVNAMIDKLDSLKQKSEVEGMDPKQAGLEGDQGKQKVSVKDDAGKESALVIGEDNPFDGSLYVKKAGDSMVRLVLGADKAPFEKELFDLRDKRVAHVDDAAEVRKLVVLPGPPGSGKLARSGAADPYAYSAEKEAGTWKLLAPAPGAADGGAVDRVVTSVKSLRAVQVAAESATASQLKEFGLALPKVSVALTVAPPGGKDTFQRTILLGQPASGKGSVAVKTYAKRDDSNTVFEVDNQILKDLAKEPFELQDKLVLKFDREAVRKLEVANQGAELVSILRKKEAPPDGGPADETFEVQKPRQGPAKKWKISGNLYSLGGLRASSAGEPLPKDPAGLAKYGLDKPRVVTVLGDGDKVLARLSIGAESDKEKKRRWVHAEGAPKVVEVEKGTMDDLPKSVDDAIEAPPPPALSLPDGGVAPAGQAAKAN